MTHRRGAGRSGRTWGRKAWSGIAVAALLLAACGGDDGDDGGGAATPTQGGVTSAGQGTTTAPAAEGVFVTDSGGQGYAEGEPRHGGEITIGMESMFLPLDPASTSALAQASRAVYGALIDIDHEGNYVPSMAESITGNEDSTTWTMKLRPGINFTDGTPYDAAAVIYNIERLKDPATKYAQVNNLAPIESVTAPDPLTVVFQLNRPFPVFPSLLGPSWGSSYIASPKALAELGEDYGRQAVGAGPFKMESWSESAIVLVRNPDYWEEGVPYLDKVTLIPTLDSQAELAAVQTGDVDIALTQAEPDWARAEDNGVKVLRQVSFTQTATLFNVDREPVNDVRVRRALKLAIDEEAIVEAVFAGEREVAIGPATPNHPYYSAVEGYPGYDPDEARRLIQEYEAETGKEVRFDFDTWDPPEFVRMFTVIQQMWAAVGAEVTMRPLGQAAQVADALAGNYTAHSRYNGSPWRIPPDVGLYNFFHSKGGGNVSNIADPELDAALEAAVATSDEDERQRQFGIAQQRLSDLLPMLYHNVQAQAFYVGEKVKGFPGGDAAVPTFFHVEEVWVG